MKIKIEYIIPRMVVSETIEVGKIRNNTLNKKQSSQVDALLKNILMPKMKKLLESKPNNGLQIKIKHI